MIEDRRKENIPFFPYVLLLLAIAFFVFAGGYYINFPEEKTILYSILSTGLIFTILSVVFRPKIIAELFFTKKTALWINDFIFILMIIGIGVLVSHIAFRRNYKYDFTRNKMYSLSDLTIKTLKELNKEVKLYAFFLKNSSEEGIMLDLFKEYKRYSDKIKCIMIDPQRDPANAKRMNIQVVGTVIVECEANRQVILPNDLFYFPNKLNVKSKENDSPAFLGEQAITSAVLNVLNNEKHVVAFISGHEEASIKGFRPTDISGLNQLLVSENIEVVENTLITGEIDSRANVVAIISPKKDFNETEISKLRSFVQLKKGNLIFAFDPTRNLNNLKEFVLKEYAISPNYDIVVDPKGISMNYWAVAPELGKHDIATPLKSKNLISILFHSCSLTKETRPDISHEVLLKTIEYSWAKRNLDSGKIDYAFDNQYDVRGPFDLGIIATKTNTASGSKAIVFGDSDFITNSLIGTSGNRDLILNSINWLAGNHKMISISPRTLELPTIQFTSRDSNMIFSICVLFVPSIIFLVGIVVFFQRRRVL